MKANMGNIDRAIRVIIALLIGVFYLAGQISGTAALILGIVAIVLVFTSAIAFCPAYLPFGLTTMGKNTSGK
jgi:Na+(H+)/acetate symporter ActP